MASEHALIEGKSADREAPISIVVSACDIFHMAINVRCLGFGLILPMYMNVCSRDKKYQEIVGIFKAYYFKGVNENFSNKTPTSSAKSVQD